MYHNYFFLKRLAADLDSRLRGLTFLECFSQHKDELVLGFGSANDQLYIKATLENRIALLSFTEDFKRAKKNSVDLFPELIKSTVSHCHVFSYDRSFQIVFENGMSLLFKMHGSRSNILLAQNDQVFALFKNNLPQDISIIPSQLNKIAPDKSLFANENGNPQKVLPALGKEIITHFFTEQYDQLSLGGKWDYFQNVIEVIDQNPITILQDDESVSLTLLEEENEDVWQTENAILASSEYYLRFTKSFFLNTQKIQLSAQLKNKIKKSENYLNKTKGKLKSLKSSRSYEEIANIIMANLHSLNNTNGEVELFDFYANQNISITLKPKTTPQKQAEQLYRKSKNQKIEIQKLEENIAARTAELIKNKEELNEISSADNLKALRPIAKQQKTQAEPENLPYHFFEFSGYEILVGKNSKHNDELTTKIANKNDLWLHAKDVPGSHVVIRNHSNKSVPTHIIEHAAQLAAWFSKRKTDSLCPVIYTPKKFVRKIKGMRPGMVKVDKEDVIMVVPTKP